MKNFKKLFAVAASVMMLASTVPTAVLGATSYSDELQGAYDYAYGIGVTTQSSIDNANMFGSLIRSHMAKMMVNYAEEVKGMTPDTSLDCEFTDVANQTEELQGYIKTACQLGLMGQGITAFNPNGIVTRAQFGTVLSRVLYGDANNGGDPYYADHLAALKDAGIMNNISNPNAPEVRGYVMLMMQRAAEGTTPAICDTPENTLSCSLGLDTCPAQCVTNTVKDGNLNISLDSSTPAGAEIPGLIPSFQTAVYKFTADKDVRLDAVVLKRAGFGAATAISSAALFINGARVSKSTTFNSTTDEVTLNLTNGYEMKGGEAVKLAVNVPVADKTVGQGNTFNITLKNVASSAQDVSYASNLTSSTFKIASANVVAVDLTGYSSVADPKVGQTNAELFKFSVTNNNHSTDVTVNSMMFKQIGDSDVNTNLSNFKLLADGVSIASASALNGKYLTFNNLWYVVKRDKTPKFTVTADVNGAASKSIQFQIEKQMDVVGVDSTYGYGANITLGGTTTITFAAKTISAGKLTLARINPVSTDLIGNRKDVVLGQLEINNTAGKTLTLNKFGLKVAVTYTGVAYTVTGVFENFRVKVNGGSSYDLDNNGTTNIYSDSSISMTLPAGKTTLTILADTLDKNLTNIKVDTSLDVNSTYFNVTENENDQVVSDINPLGTSALTWRTLEGTNANAIATNVILANREYVQGASNVEVVKFKVKAGSASLVNIKELEFTAKGTGGTVVIGDTNPLAGATNLTDSTITSAKLSWGTESKTANVSAGTISFAGMNIDVAASQQTEFVLTVNISKTTSTNGVYVDLTSITAEDKDGKTTTVSGTPLKGRVVVVTDQGTLNGSVDTDAIKYNKNILAGTTTGVAQYKVYSTNEEVKIEQLSFASATDLTSEVTDAKVYLGTELVAQNATITSNAITFAKADLGQGNGFSIGTTQTPLRLELVTKKIDNANDRWSAITNATIGDMVMTGYGVDSSAQVVKTVVGTNNKNYSIVPVLVTVAKAGNGTLKVTLDKGSNNNTTDGSDLVVTLTGVVMTQNTQYNVSQYVLAYPDGTTIAKGTGSTVNFVGNTYTTLRNGDELTVTATPNGTDPSYTLSLPVETVRVTVDYGADVVTYYSRMDGIISNFLVK